MSAYESFRSRDFRFFLTAGLLSNFGMQMLSVAVSWDLYLETKSAVVLGNVGFVQVAPFLIFALLAGHFADRHDRRRIMMWTQAMVILASALLTGHTRSVALIYSVLFLTATARAFQGPARLAILPHVVSSDSLRNAITWHSSAQEIANVTGPALAGILLASAGSRAVYLTQVGCATLTWLCVYLLDVRFESNKQVGADRKELLEGVRFVRRHELILPAISLDLFAVLFGGATALLPIFAVDILHANARGFGWLRSAPSLGAVSMAILLSHLPRAKRRGTSAAVGGGWFRGGDDRVRDLAFFVAVVRDAGRGGRMRQRKRSAAAIAGADADARRAKGARVRGAEYFHQLLQSTGRGGIGMDRGMVRTGVQRRGRRNGDDRNRNGIRGAVGGAPKVDAIRVVYVRTHYGCSNAGGRGSRTYRRALPAANESRKI